ncbi:NACHT domain-containing protein [Planomonospora sp. ID91781]|uniref:NACHT domain-containing protein n=1 Tax=Planomonospora sp. ID91781 TaxID=2738135 RepID=UPI0018C43A12|nr:NACHT domain-containing protein [Planomonospora sp. ID91781]MBG0819417.1 NACHT domain-containing protein [Planomonospora sp. ID91781]
MKAMGLRATALWLAGILLPVALNVAINQVLNDGVWSRPWIVTTIVLAFAGWYTAYLITRASAPAAGDIAQVKRHLAELVDGFWNQEMARRSLGDPPIPVPWRLTTRARFMDHPHLIAEGEFSFTGRSDEIDELASRFRGLRRRRLVILGGAGTGKTTLAIQLLVKLIATREEEDPVPVLLPVADWDVDVHPRLHDWVAARLRNDYLASATPVNGRDSAEILASNGHILAILDGLDELPEAVRVKVMNQLSRTLAPRDQVIITSRTREYGDAVVSARRAVRAAAVIAPRALTAEAVVDYLTACLPPRPPQPWNAVLQALRAGEAPALTAVSSTALGLWLIRAVYVDQDRDPAPLLTVYRDDAPALRAHLMDNLVEALLLAEKTSGTADRRVIRSWDAERVNRLLGRLARSSPETGAGGFAWWQLAWAVRGRSRSEGFGAPPRWIVYVVSGLVYGLPVAIAPALGGSPAVGFSAALTFGFASLSLASETPEFTRLRVGRYVTALLREHGGRVVPASLWMSLPLGVAVAYSEGIGAGLFMGAASMLTLWFGISSTRAIALPKESGRAPEDHIQQFSGALTPLSSWRINRSLFGLRLVGALALGAVLAVSADVVLSHFSGRRDGWTDIGLGILVGSSAGIAQRPRHAWLASRITFTFLAISGELPARAMTFFDEMHRIGVLRAVGPFYQFRHAELHDHFASATSAGTRDHRPAATRAAPRS